MVVIEESALKAAKLKKADYVVKVLSASGGEFDIDVKSIIIELVQDFEALSGYIKFEYEGVKVYINKNLIIEDDLLIYRRYKLPIIGSVWGIKGVSIKYM